MKTRVFLLLIILMMTSLCAYADGDLWDNFGDQNVYGQKAVTDEEFEQAIESKKGKPKKQKDKLLRNGEAFQESNETAFLKSVPKELPILLIPVDLALDENRVLPVGHYQVMGEKRDGKVYLKLYQAHNLLTSLEAAETNDDFGEEEINFVKLLEDGENRVKIIFGSLAFNAYTTVNISR